MQARLLTFAVIVGIVLCVTASPPQQVGAASSGLAWDSVTKFVQTNDPSSLQPGSFQSDYASASAVQVATDTGGGGFLAKAKAAMKAAQGVMDTMQKGFAVRHYIAGTKERTDTVSYQTATIRDCSARTITTLNLAKKTYKVESMDHPSTPSTGGTSHGAPGPAPTDDGSKLAIEVKNTSLGAKQVEGVPTQGYQSNVKMTVTKPSGESNTSNTSMRAYFSQYSEPVLNCSTFGLAMPPAPGMGANPMAAGGAEYSNLMRALAMGPNSKISITQSGPPMQAGKLTMFNAMTMSGDSARGGSITIVDEKGNVRSIDANDSAFSVPSDFTKEQ